MSPLTSRRWNVIVGGASRQREDLHVRHAEEELEERKEAKARKKKEDEADGVVGRGLPDPRSDMGSGSSGGPNITGGAGGVM